MATPDEIDEFLVEYQQALSSFDADRSVAQWGAPGMILSDTFVGALSSTAEMAQGLQQAYPLYRELGLASVGHTLLDHAELTDHITRIRVRWHMDAADGTRLVDTDYEYLLRRDGDKLRAYVAVAIDEMEKLAELAAARGLELPTP